MPCNDNIIITNCVSDYNNGENNIDNNSYK